MVAAASGASRSRVTWSCRNAPRPIMRPSAATRAGALIWDANLGFGAGAAQEFGLVDDGDAERLRPLELRSGVGTDHQRGGLLGDAIDDVPAGRLDQLDRLGAREGRQRAGHHEYLSRQRT